MKLNSWAPTEIVNDRAVKSTPQPRTTSLSTPPKSKLTTSSYAEKYHAMSVQRANQVAERHSSKSAETTTGSSYAEMHRAKVKKDRSKLGGAVVTLSQTTPSAGSSVNSYALLYKRGTIASKAKASSSAEPAVGEQTPKETVLRGTQSVTPTPHPLQSSFSGGEDDLFSTTHRKAFSMSLSSSWPDWSEMRPFGRLSPVSHSKFIYIFCIVIILRSFCYINFIEIPEITVVRLTLYRFPPSLVLLKNFLKLINCRKR